MTESVWGDTQLRLREILRRHPDDVPAVVDQLTELQDLLEQLPPPLRDNPVSDFNRRYLAITEDVLERLYAGRFADPVFVSRLDVEFATRYFDALRAFTNTSRSCPRSWAGLFQRSCGSHPRSARAACAGFNAHVNFDLPFALVTTFDHLGTEPVDDSDQHRDYLQVAELVGAALPELGCGRLCHARVLIETMNGTGGDQQPGEPAPIAHQVAWRNAQLLWAVRHDLTATNKQRAYLDGVVADLGERLLAPLGSGS